MEHLMTGKDGKVVRQHVEEERKQEGVNVTNHHLNLEEIIVAILSQRTRSVMHFHAQLTVNTLCGAPGRFVRQHAVVVLCFAQELVVTQSLDMVEGLVTD